MQLGRIGGAPQPCDDGVGAQQPRYPGQRLEVVGTRPTGWYCGRTSVNTVDLASEEGGFTYVSDTYDDDLPYYREHMGSPQLIIPYSLATNDMRFTTASGFANGEEYFQMLKDSFDVLYAEGEAGAPKMMSVGLHCRLVQPRHPCEVACERAAYRHRRRMLRAVDSLR